MKKTKTMKAKVLSMMAAMLLLSGNLFAQYNENRYGVQPWFGETNSMLNRNSGSNNVQFGNTRDGGTSGLGWSNLLTQDPTQPAPLGSGLLVLTAAGAGYAVVKRRKQKVQKGKVLMMAMVLMLTFTQCKKNDETIVSTTDGVKMTLYANYGAKTSFTDAGAISWTTGDVIYVIKDGACIGSLTKQSGVNEFSGPIEGLSEGDNELHYYYVGTEQTIEKEATSFSMDFVNQDGTLANLGKFHVGYGAQTLNYSGSGDVTAETSMSSLVSIGYFDIAGMAEVGEKVYMYGEALNNKITIDFSTNTPTFTKVDTEHNNNYICLGQVAEGATCGRYVMLVPNHTNGAETLATNITFVSKRTTGTCNDNFPYGVIANRFYCKSGNTVSPIDVDAASYDAGVLRGVFSVDKSYNQEPKKVRFSQGNLQYLAFENKWQFAESQYTYIGNNPGNSTDPGSDPDSDNRSNQNEWIDLFNWGASGYDSKYPYIIYPKSYTAPTSISGTNYDWGVQNAVYNGGNTANVWYTMTSTYWNTILNNTTYRPTDRYLKAKIGSTYGLIVFADDYLVPCGVSYSGTNTASTNWSVCWDATDVWEMMETAGAVFLPAAGHSRTYTGFSIVNCNSIGKYWTTTTNSSNSNTLTFTDSQTQYNYSTSRNTACSVRLVKDVE